MYRISASLALAMLLACGASAAQSRSVDSEATHYAWANVTRVNPIFHDVEVADTAQDCYQQPVVRQERAGGSTAGTLLGAVVGGVLGNTIGKGDGRRAATVAGAVAGGAVGNRVSRQSDRVVHDSVTRCEPVRNVSMERRIVGYNVEYRYRGQSYMSRMDYDPGERLRVRVSVTPAD